MVGFCRACCGGDDRWIHPLNVATLCCGILTLCWACHRARADFSQCLFQFSYQFRFCCFLHCLDGLYEFVVDLVGMLRWCEGQEHAMSRE